MSSKNIGYWYEGKMEWPTQRMKKKYRFDGYEDKCQNKKINNERVNCILVSALCVRERPTENEGTVKEKEREGDRQREKELNSPNVHWTTTCLAHTQREDAAKMHTRYIDLHTNGAWNSSQYYHKQCERVHSICY